MNGGVVYIKEYFEVLAMHAWHFSYNVNINPLYLKLPAPIFRLVWFGGSRMMLVFGVKPFTIKSTILLNGENWEVFFD